MQAARGFLDEVGRGPIGPLSRASSFFHKRVSPAEAFVHPAWAVAKVEALEALAGGPVVLVIRGPAGVGKTLLLQEIEQTLLADGAEVFVRQGHDIVIDGAPVDGAPVQDGRRRRVVIIDEASRMELAALGSLQTLGPCSVVLAGLAELSVDPAMALSNAVVVDLEPMAPGDVAAFVADRLGRAGLPADLISPAAVARLAAQSAGVPRLLNTLAGGAFHLASVNGADRVRAEHVDLAATFREIESESPAAEEGETAPLPPETDPLPDGAQPATGWEAPAPKPARRRLAVLGVRQGTMLLGGAAAIAVVLLIAVLIGDRPVSPLPASPMVADAPPVPAPAVSAPPVPAPQVGVAALPSGPRAEPASPAAPEPTPQATAPEPPPPPEAPHQLAESQPPPAISASPGPPSQAPLPETTEPAASITAVPPAAGPTPKAGDVPPPGAAPDRIAAGPAQPATPPPAYVRLPSSAPLQVVLRTAPGGAAAAGQAAGLAETLRAAGFMVLDVQLAAARRDAKPGVRYFFADDGAAADAVLKAAGLPGGSALADGAAFATASKIALRPGLIELVISGQPSTTAN